MKKIALLIAFLLLLPGFADAEGQSYPLRKIIDRILGREAPMVDDSEATPEKIKTVVDANNRFAIDLYLELSSQDENIFFSPYSISTALAMVYEGAKGETAEEIQRVLHFPERDIRRPGFAGLYNEINEGDELSTANALWIQKEYRVLEEYLSVIRGYYGGDARNVDFVSDPEGSRKTINNWVEEQTRDRIKELIPEGMIDPLTALVLTNGVYFKGKWATQFDERDTKEEDFKVTPDRKVKVKMMFLEGGEFNYTENDELQMVELPYDGENISMLVILPKVKELEMNMEKLAELKSMLQERSIDLYLPRFKIETKYFMNDLLSGMGMPTAFSDRADFSGITGSRDLLISQVIHQAFVEVDEEGTEAAAATAVMQTLGITVSTVFKADHPFIFIIQQNENVLFMGKVYNPTEG